MAWGYHLSLDCYGGELSLIKNGDNIAAFAKELVKRIDMKAYGEPQVIHFGEGNKQGYTLVQLIETSNICAHFCDDTGNFYLDVFSCKPYDTQQVHRVVEQFFSPDRIVENYLERE